MKRFFNPSWLLLLLVIYPFIGFSQVTKYEKERKRYEQEREKLLADISFTENAIKEILEIHTVSLHYLETLKAQILMRNRLINTIYKEIEILNKQVTIKKTAVSELEEELLVLKEEYARMIIAAYKTKSSYSKLLFLFSANDFNDLIKRYKYIEQYAQYRKRQAVLITKKQDEIAKEITHLNYKKKDKQKLLKSHKNQKQALGDEKNEQNQLVNSLNQKESQLQKELKTKRNAAHRLEKKIEEVIKMILTLNKPKVNDPLAMTPEAIAKLSSGFARNKGKLPWPVERCVVTGRFGRHKHPTLKRVEINNNGIIMKTSPNAIVRTIFDGTVSHIGFIPNIQKYVMINHGKYFTVYTNLKTVYVKYGDQVTTKQTIGRAYTDESEAKTEVHLQVWEPISSDKPKPVDPLTWLHPF